MMGRFKLSSSHLSLGPSVGGGLACRETLAHSRVIA